MPTGTIYRKSQWLIQLSVDGVTSLDSESWDKAQGGDINPTMAKHSPGGMAPNVAIGGRRERTDITLERAWDDNLIVAAIDLDNASGFTPVTVSLTPLRKQNQTAGKPIIRKGVLGPVTWPEADSESSDAAMLTVVCSLNEGISGGGA